MACTDQLSTPRDAGRGHMQRHRWQGHGEEEDWTKGHCRPTYCTEVSFVSLINKHELTNRRKPDPAKIMEPIDLGPGPDPIPRWITIRAVGSEEAVQAAVPPSWSQLLTFAGSSVLGGAAARRVFRASGPELHETDFDAFRDGEELFFSLGDEYVAVGVPVADASAHPGTAQEGASNVGGAALAGAGVGVGGAVLLGGGLLAAPVFAVAGAGAAAYAATRKDNIGETAREAGSKTLKATEGVREFDRKHGITQGAKDAVQAVGTKVTKINEEHKITERASTLISGGVGKAKQFNEEHQVTQKAGAAVAATGRAFARLGGQAKTFAEEHQVQEKAGAAAKATIGWGKKVGGDLVGFWKKQTAGNKPPQ